MKTNIYPDNIIIELVEEHSINIGSTATVSRFVGQLLNNLNIGTLPSILDSVSLNNNWVLEYNWVLELKGGC